MSSDLDPHVQYIRDAIWSGSGPRGLASVMVGAGFSRNAERNSSDAPDFPLWRDLAQSMGKELGLDLDHSAEPLRLAQMYEAKFGRKHLEKLLTRIIPDQQHRPGELHRRLLALPWADVFTTNYDTLLERTSLELYERRYARVLIPQDIPMQQAPRLAKLHGTLGQNSHLIVTQEDYRGYPRNQASFVNLVRESVMETVFVLLGFTGDDPNFLEWAGWVHDELGDAAPKIFLCGCLNLSPAELPLLQQRRVTPLDLSPLFPSGSDRHSRAMDWFLAALENGRPSRATSWAEREPAKIKQRHPALPPAKVFTSFSDAPPANWQTIDVDRLQEIQRTWRIQRMEYPGWHVAPDKVRERVLQVTDHWRRPIFVRAVALPSGVRLLLLYELCWRLDLVLSPLFTSETNQLADWLEELNPFGPSVSLPGASLPDSGDPAAVRIAWTGLALNVLRTAREDLDERRYHLWRSRLLLTAEWDHAMSGELAHEEALWHLTNLDSDALQQSLETWRALAKQPEELLRLAAYYAEVGDRHTAINLATAALEHIRQGELSPLNTSLDAWASLLLSILTWYDDDKRTEFRERIAQTRKQEYDPWHTIEGFKEKLKYPRPPWSPAEQHTAGFDPGTVSRRRSLSRDDDLMPARQLLRLMERAPCPLHICDATVFGESTTHAAIWLANEAPFWTLSILMRASLKPEMFDEVFGREIIAVLEADQVARLYHQMLTLAEKSVSRLKGREDGICFTLRGHLLLSAWEMISRLALRLGPKDLAALLELVIRWLSDPAVARHHELQDPLQRLTDRIIHALPTALLPKAVDGLLTVPFPTEDGLVPAIPEHWPEPFEYLQKIKVPSPKQRSREWPQHLSRLLRYITSDTPEFRDRAFTRLYFLYDNDWLDAGEQAAFGDACWKRTEAKANGLPSIRGYSPHLALYLPGAKAHNAMGKIKSQIIAWKPSKWRDPTTNMIATNKISETDGWFVQIERVFLSPAHKAHDGGLHPDLTADEAANLLRRILAGMSEWRQVLMSKNYRRWSAFHSVEAEVFTDHLSRALSCLLLWLPSGHALAKTCEDHLQQFAAEKLPISGSAPGRLFQQPALLSKITTQFASDLMSDRECNVESAANTLLSWQMAVQAQGIPALPSSLVNLLVAHVLTRTATALRNVMNALAGILRQDATLLTATQQDHLSLALERLADETNPQTIRNRYQNQEINRNKVATLLNLRQWSAWLACALMHAAQSRGESVPPGLMQWQSISADDPLPEVRRAWAAN